MRKEKKIQFRVSARDDSRIRNLAKIYAKGNISRWIVYAAIEAPRKKLK